MNIHLSPFAPLAFSALLFSFIGSQAHGVIQGCGLLSSRGEWTGAIANERAGAALARLDDVDGDGIADLAVGAPGGNGSSGVMILSGATGRLIRRHEGWRGSRFGHDVAGLGDLDGDGRGDYAIAAPMKPNVAPRAAPKVGVYSGATGQRLYGIPARMRWEKLGFVIEAIADLDGDGLTDLLVGNPDARQVSGGNGMGSVTLHSGADGTVLLETWGGPSDWGYGRVATVLGDIDGDGLEDFAVGLPGAGANGSRNGLIRIISSASGLPLLEIQGSRPSALLGEGLAGVGDQDQDGIPDLVSQAVLYSGATGNPIADLGQSAVGVHWTGPAARLGDLDGDGVEEFSLTGSRFFGTSILEERVQLHHGGDWTLLYAWDDLEPGGSSLRRFDDLDGDGVTELVLALPGAGTAEQGRLEALSWAPGLLVPVGQLSVAAGGALLLGLELPVAFAGSAYQVLFSASGAGPSVVGGVSVPLTVDWFLVQNLLGHYPPWVRNPVGRLDGRGDALIALLAGAGQLPASLANRSFRAAVLIGPGPFQWTDSTISRPFLILP